MHADHGLSVGNPPKLRKVSVHCAGLEIIEDTVKIQLSRARNLIVQCKASARKIQNCQNEASCRDNRLISSNALRIDTSSAAGRGIARVLGSNVELLEGYKRLK